MSVFSSGCNRSLSFGVEAGKAVCEAGEPELERRSVSREVAMTVVQGVTEDVAQAVKQVVTEGEEEALKTQVV